MLVSMYFTHLVLLPLAFAYITLFIKGLVILKYKRLRLKTFSTENFFES